MELVTSVTWHQWRRSWRCRRCGRIT